LAYSKYNKRRFEGEKPVQEGETYDIEIIATGAKGDGIGKVKGFVVIVPDAKPGQKIKVRVDAVRGKVAFGTVSGEAASVPSPGAEAQAESDELTKEAVPEKDAATGESVQGEATEEPPAEEKPAPAAEGKVQEKEKPVAAAEGQQAREQEKKEEKKKK